jgi:hypothetical protein
MDPKRRRVRWLVAGGFTAGLWLPHIVYFATNNKETTGDLKELVELAEFAGVDIKTFKRTGSTRRLWQEIGDVQKARNLVLHQGGTAEDGSADLAITVVSALLNDIFPQILTNLGLRFDV